MPESLAAALRRLGHEVDTVGRLGLKGAADAGLLKVGQTAYDLLFTKDREFAQRARRLPPGSKPAFVHVTLRQERAGPYTASFLSAFRGTRWEAHESGADWP